MPIEYYFDTAYDIKYANDIKLPVDVQMIVCDDSLIGVKRYGRDVNFETLCIEIEGRLEELEYGTHTPHDGNDVFVFEI